MNTIHISLAAEEIIRFGSFALTNSMLASLIASGLIAGLFIMAARSVRVWPAKNLSFALESASDALLDFIADITRSRQRALDFFPLLMTFFVFILVNNWLGLLPGVGSITLTLAADTTVPLFRGATADLNTTLSLAIISVVMTHLYAIRELGLFGHLKKYVSFNPILLFVGLLEFIAEFAKMVSFSFRLFGNIFAGEVLLVVISSLAPVLAPLPFFILELFVGLVQALVFTMLTLVFLTIAVSDHSGHTEHAA